MSKIRIALDFDGVLADTLILKQRWLADHMHLTCEARLLTRGYLVDLIGEKKYADMQQKIGYEDTLTCAPVRGCLKTIRALSGKFEFVIVTSRYLEKMKWVDRWLEKYLFKEYITNVINAEGEEKLVVSKRNECDYLVDNDLRHLIPNVQRNIKKIHFCPSSHPMPNYDGVTSVKSWYQLCDFLTKDTTE